MEYGHGAEVQRGSEERDGPCQLPPGGKLTRRNLRAGQKGRPPSERNRRVYCGTLLKQCRRLSPRSQHFLSAVQKLTHAWPLSTNRERTIPPRPFRLSPLFPHFHSQIFDC